MSPGGVPGIEVSQRRGSAVKVMPNIFTDYPVTKAERQKR